MKRIFEISSIAACILLLASCAKEEQKEAKAVLATRTEINFEAKGNDPQVITVYSDAPWHAEVPDWITIDPVTGNGTVDVTIIASDNYSGQEMLAPRKDTLVFCGSTILSRCMVKLTQKGDTYKGAPEVFADGLASVGEGKALILKSSQVMARTNSGAVISSGGKNAFVYLSKSCSIGDMITLKGIRQTENGFAVVASTEDVSTTAGTASYPEAADVTKSIKDYPGTSMEYVFVAGQLKAAVGGGYNVIPQDTETETAALIQDPVNAAEIEGLKGHNVEITGYTFGKNGGSSVRVILVNITDKGLPVVKPEKPLRAKWRFTTSLLVNYASYFGGTAGVNDKTAGDGGMYVPSLVEGDGRITYVQIDKTAIDVNGKAVRIIGGTGHPYVTGAWPGDYWLFTATDGWPYEAGTKLHIKYLTRDSATGQKYWMLEYWDGEAWQPADEYEMKTETDTGDNNKYNFVEPTSNVAVECNWVLKVACSEPKFRMRCVANWQANGSGPLSAPNGGTCRIADNDDDKEDAGPVFEVIE